MERVQERKAGFRSLTEAVDTPSSQVCPSLSRFVGPSLSQLLAGRGPCGIARKPRTKFGCESDWIQVVFGLSLSHVLPPWADRSNILRFEPTFSR